jgi:hypothetical protein
VEENERGAQRNDSLEGDTYGAGFSRGQRRGKQGLEVGRCRYYKRWGEGGEGAYLTAGSSRC